MCVCVCICVSPKASRRAGAAGAAKENRHENPISQIARFGRDMKPKFDQIQKNTGGYMYM